MFIDIRHTIAIGLRFVGLVAHLFMCSRYFQLILMTHARRTHTIRELIGYRQCNVLHENTKKKHKYTQGQRNDHNVNLVCTGLISNSFKFSRIHYSTIFRIFFPFAKLLVAFAHLFINKSNDTFDKIPMRKNKKKKR